MFQSRDGCLLLLWKRSTLQDLFLWRFCGHFRASSGYRPNQRWNGLAPLWALIGHPQLVAWFSPHKDNLGHTPRIYLLQQFRRTTLVPVWAVVVQRWPLRSYKHLARGTGRFSSCLLPKMVRSWPRFQGSSVPRCRIDNQCMIFRWGICKERGRRICVVCLHRRYLASEGDQRTSM